jgi:hypothetical protein
VIRDFYRCNSSTNAKLRAILTTMQMVTRSLVFCLRDAERRIIDKCRKFDSSVERNASSPANAESASFPVATNKLVISSKASNSLFQSELHRRNSLFVSVTPRAQAGHFGV